MSRYMNKKNIDGDLKNRIKNYLFYIWKEEEIEDEEEEKIAIDNLSNVLREELLLKSNVKIISNIPILYKNFSTQFLKKISTQFRHIRKAPGEILSEVLYIKSHIN